MKCQIKINQRPIEYREPFELYRELSNNGNNIGLLLESRSKNKHYGRRSIIVPNPIIEITGKEENFRIRALNEKGKEVLGYFRRADFSFVQDLEYTGEIISGRVRRTDNPNLSEEERILQTNMGLLLKTIIKKFHSDNEYAGLYGALAYDFSKNFYFLKSKLEKTTADFKLFIPSEAIVLDEITKTGTVYNFFGESTPVRGFEFFKKGSLESDISEEDYLKNARQIIQDIKNGRVTQCVFSRQLSMPLLKNPIDSYSTLRNINPSPYSFFFNFGNNEILYGASPERHIAIENGIIDIRPIAGTIRRSKNPLEDELTKKAFYSSQKELCEHTMLVDLARHEICNLSETGTMEVYDFQKLEEYPNLYHLVSGIKGKLKQKFDSIDALLVTMPAGTLSGSPKLEAMKMIEEYESSNRGYYGGTIGYVSFNGNCNTGITIRSIHIREGRAYVRAGGGITIKSTPEDEFNETKLKMEKTIMSLNTS